MELRKDNYCIILAGGRGRRLWPCSRDQYPKQFIDFFGTGRTQLQATYDRFARLLPQENILVCTNREYAHLVKEQLPELSDSNMIVEPVSRNTAPSATWAVLKILTRDREASVVISPSDQLVMNEAAFAKNIHDGLELVAHHDTLLTMGVTPTRPEPGYGYVQMGDATDTPDTSKVKSFTEKPERDFAKMFVESGEFLWNTGMFLAKADYFNRCCASIFPEVADSVKEFVGGITIDNELRFISENYAAFPNLSIDYGILERCDNVCVMKCGFGWADLGTWHSIYECMKKGNDDNVVVDSNVMLNNCRNNVIKIPKDKLAVIDGLDGYIVAEKDNVLLICKKGDTSGLMRKYVNEVQLKYGEDFI